MDPTRFDGLVRSFARPASRRSALGALAGGALGLLAGASTGDARRKRHHPGHRRKGGNSDCARFCHDVFGDTAAADQCVSDGAHGNGLCTLDACQSQGRPDAGNVCCVKTGGFCVNYADATCCSGSDCGANGQCGCTPNCSGKCNGASDGCGGMCNDVCPAGADCLSSICSCRHNPCPNGSDSECDASQGEICNNAGATGPNCCCSPSGNTLVPCGPGPNPICCSGVCGDNNVCL